MAKGPLIQEYGSTNRLPTNLLTMRSDSLLGVQHTVRGLLVLCETDESVEELSLGAALRYLAHR
jgi:hypothetical protein